MRCGLLGRKLSHSYSPQIHAMIGNYPYALFEREPNQLSDFLKNSDFTGINVTIPYKKDVIPYCSSISPIARRLGAVNTIIKDKDGNLIGHTTDYFGFCSMVPRTGLDVAGKKVLVLGSGGGANTVIAVLNELGANVVVISRSGENNYENLPLHKDAAVIVNATPVGMYPNVDASPVDLDLFANLEGVLDLIYNPARTELLMQAENRGLVTENGLWMLVAQAKESAEWFLNKQISDDIIAKIHKSLRAQMENIILIGMPGCGKSTIADLLGQTMHRKVVDADAEIVKAAGITIPEIFEKHGEAEFRRIESQVLSLLCKESGLVIATGGGCVTQPQNYASMHRNGTIIYITRQLDVLPTDGRPLSQSGNLEAMYQQRRPFYEAFADYCISNDGELNDAVNAIRRVL